MLNLSQRVLTINVKYRILINLYEIGGKCVWFGSLYPTGLLRPNRPRKDVISVIASERSERGNPLIVNIFLSPKKLTTSHICS